ncbi:carbohydrate kinase family protein [Neobacillus massiliamazoniensis]|uniref:Carbohydrate kinase family protein n=1 Tax=Neobacillus massiliamazoniensis TaxID=1499688 RepID=A0A0U1NVV1_9BACI|nr:carbohydrate kinase family protein [Neobacillus massiliamazoniensis]
MNLNRCVNRPLVKENSYVVDLFFTGDVKAVIYTKGEQGAELYLDHETYQSTGYPVEVQDTTGAGDALIGVFLYQLLEKNVSQQNLEEVLHHHYQEILSFANASGALTTTGKGAISSLPTKEEISHLQQKFKQ